MRSLLRLATALAVIASGLIAPTVVPTDGGTPAASAKAADLRFFDPGNIISDAIFYDSLAMNAADVQYFLNLKGANCQPGTDGTACLKDYAIATTDRAADSLCSGYRAGGVESSATIITRIAVACGVSPRVLLVLLQKEMGLVTGTKPTAKKYERAAGYACPDSANGGCDPRYAGLQNQLYWSAWQYRKYAANPSGYAHVAGRVNNILWSPNNCGSSQVFIVNQATAGLYNYTPYRPNQAALDAGYGTGDGCSSYGNRNFWNYFTDWFGSTQSVGAGAIYAKYQSLGANGSNLGNVASTFYCGLANGGCFQVFGNGAIYWTPATGAWSVTGAMQTKWGELGREWGTLGYPLSDMNCGLIAGGCYQVFERGTIYWTAATGAFAAYGPLGGKWISTGAENGSLGYPVGDVGCGLAEGGCYQPFERGLIYWTSATDARIVSGDIGAKWSSLGREWGALGYPVMDRACGLVDGGCYQIFQRGTVYSSPNAGVHVTKGTIGSSWVQRGAENGLLGYPVGDEVCGLAGGGCSQDFEDGSIFLSSATGIRAVSGPIRDRYNALNRERGPLGYPTTEIACGLLRDGCYQVFQYGTVYSSPSAGLHIAKGGIGYKWMSGGAENGPLGYPVGDETCGLVGGGCRQDFESGSIFWSGGTGAHAVSGAIQGKYNAVNREQGPLGYPTTDMVCGLVRGGCYQVFQYGTVYDSPVGAHIAKGGLGYTWMGLGAENGTMGYPVADEQCGLRASGCAQAFEHGSVYYSPAYGAFPVNGPIQAAWVAQGAENGTWGYPTAKPQTTGGVTTQRFEGGTARLDTSAGTVTFG